MLIKTVGLTESQYGWLGIFIAMAALTGGAASKRLSHALTSYQLMKVGMIVMLSSSILFVAFALFLPISHADKGLSCLLIILPMMGLVFSAFGFLIPATLSSALLKYQKVLGRAGALFGLSYYVLNAAFTWGMGLLHNGHVSTMPVYFLALTLTIAVAFFFGVYGSHKL